MRPPNICLLTGLNTSLSRRGAACGRAGKRAAQRTGSTNSASSEPPPSHAYAYPCITHESFLTPLLQPSRPSGAGAHLLPSACP